MKTFVRSGALLLVWCIGQSFAENTVQEQNVIAGIDPATEVRLGTLFRDNLIKKYHLSTNREYISTVERIGRRIANAIYERPDLAEDWEFTVLNSGSVNAFATGGGKVVVYERLIDRCVVDGKIDEDMLASVIGHEMAHNVRRHLIQKESIAGSMDWILEHLKEIKGELSETELGKLKELARARFTRIQEFEADLLGALYATRAGFDGFGGATRWMEMQAKDPSQAYSMDEYIPQDTNVGAAADHPTWKERLNALLSYKENIKNLAGEFNWGYYLLRTYDFEKAADCFKDVTKIFPNSFEAWNNLGLAYHWQYLQTAGDSEKFQPGLVDYFVQLRDRVRGESPLYKAIRAYQHALQINPYAAGTKSNLAIALIETHETENLETAELMLQQLLTDAPNDPIYLNDMAILTYWKAQEKGKSENNGTANSPEALFAKAAASDYLPAQYNLAVLRLEIGKKEDGIAGLKQYLKKDSFSPWAKFAVNLLRQNNETVDDPKGFSDAVIKVLQVQLGSSTQDVIKAIGQPDRIEQTSTSEGDEGTTYHYDNTLGMSVVFTNGKVVMINLLEPLPANEPAAVMPAVAGIQIGTNVDEMKKKLGEPVQVRVDPTTQEKVYSYVTADSIVSFTVSQLRTVSAISFSRRA
jgi:metalloendopeptidase OMA1, mitochondrial